MPVRAVCKPHSPDLKKRRSSDWSLAFLVRAPASRARVPGSRPALWVGADPCWGGYIGAVTRTGVRFRGGECNGCMPVRAVCKPHSSHLKKRRSSDWRCSLWRSLLERPPPAPESRVRDPLGELVRTRVGGVTQATLQLQTGLNVSVLTHTARADLLLLCCSPSFPFPHPINPVAYQQLLSQQRSLSAFGHTPPLLQPPPSFSSRHPLSLSALQTPAASAPETKVPHTHQFLTMLFNRFILY